MDLMLLFTLDLERQGNQAEDKEELEDSSHYFVNMTINSVIKVA